jgi:hypothetical protein
MSTQPGNETASSDQYPSRRSLGSPLGREAEDDAQHKSGALQRRQPLQTGDERQRGR